MATTLAECIVGKLIAASVIEEGDRGLYVYGFFLLITRCFFFLVTIAVGCLLEILCESVIFYIVFILLRSYAGGVHAKTEMACTVWTTVAMGGTVAAIKILEISAWEMILLVLVADICILLFSPLDSPEKPLDEKDYGKYRKICVNLLMIYNAIELIVAVLQLYTICCSVLYGMCLEAILLSTGKCVVEIRNLGAEKRQKEQMEACIMEVKKGEDYER